MLLQASVIMMNWLILQQQVTIVGFCWKVSLVPKLGLAFIFIWWFSMHRFIFTNSYLWIWSLIRKQWALGGNIPWMDASLLQDTMHTNTVTPKDDLANQVSNLRYLLECFKRFGGNLTWIRQSTQNCSIQNWRLYTVNSERVETLSLQIWTPALLLSFFIQSQRIRLQGREIKGKEKPNLQLEFRQQFAKGTNWLGFNRVCHVTVWLKSLLNAACRCYFRPFVHCSRKKKKLSSQTTYHCHWNPNTNCARANLRILQGHKSRFTVWPVPEQMLSNWFVGNEFLITPQSPAISFLWNYSLPVNMNNNVLAKHLLQQTHVQYLNSTSIL